jgi:gas vesicle protein
MSEPVTKKERLRAKDKWQMFQEQCKSMAALEGKETPPNMNKYYNDIYKAKVKEIGHSAAWTEAVDACVAQAEVEAKANTDNTPVRMTRRPRSPIEVRLKKSDLPPPAPPIDTEKFKRELLEMFAERIKEQEERASRRVSRLNKLIEKLALSGEENKELVAKVMEDATQKALETASEKGGDVSEIQDAMQEIQEQTAEALATAVGHVDNRIDDMAKKLDSGLDRIEQMVRGQEPREPRYDMDRPKFELPPPERKEVSDKEFNKIVKDIEGVCEKMYPIRTATGLEENCNAFSDDENRCNFESGGNCYYHTPSFLGGLFGSKPQCISTQESRALMGSQAQEYVQCKLDQGETVPPEFQDALQQIKGADGDGQRPPVQPVNPEFQQLVKAREQIEKSRNQILDGPPELLELPPMLDAQPVPGPDVTTTQEPPRLDVAPAPEPEPQADPINLSEPPLLDNAFGVQPEFGQPDFGAQAIDMPAPLEQLNQPAQVPMLDQPGFDDGTPLNAPVPQDPMQEQLLQEPVQNLNIDNQPTASQPQDPLAIPGAGF